MANRSPKKSRATGKTGSSGRKGASIERALLLLALCLFVLVLLARPLLKVILPYYGVVSLVTFALFGWDKWQATRGGWRLSEQVLHLAEAAGGWIGSLLAQAVFNHKTQKTPFKVVTWLIIALHLLGVAVWAHLR